MAQSSLVLDPRFVSAEVDPPLIGSYAEPVRHGPDDGHPAVALPPASRNVLRPGSTPAS
jgi:hypothetical protein